MQMEKPKCGFRCVWSLITLQVSVELKAMRVYVGFCLSQECSHANMNSLSFVSSIHNPLKKVTCRFENQSQGKGFCSRRHSGDSPNFIWKRLKGKILRNLWTHIICLYMLLLWFFSSSSFHLLSFSTQCLSEFLISSLVQGNCLPSTWLSSLRVLHRENGNWRRRFQHNLPRASYEC